MKQTKENVAERERLDFSDRLQQSLHQTGYAPDSPTILAREFNLRFEGDAVTVHAARKWLIGEAIPTQGKLRLLAEWLNVKPEWLRFGGDHGPNKAASRSPAFNIREVGILEKLQKLSPDNQQIVMTLVGGLLKAQAK